MTKLKKTRIRLYSAMGIICLLLVIGIGLYAQSYSSYKPPQTVMENVNIDSYINEAALRPLETIVKEEIKEEILGGNSIVPFPYLQVGGIDYEFRRMNMKTATTTPCAIQSPSATSTLIFHSYDFDYASSTSDSIITIAKATTAFATTTQIGYDSFILTNDQDTIIGSTTPLANVAALDSAVFNFAPDEWLVMGIASQDGISGTTYSPSGVCQAVWMITE